MASTVEVLADKVDDVKRAIKKLTDVHVMVGVPSTRTARKGEPVSNAVLGYIHEFGSPVKNIPARPFLVPGVKNVLDGTEKYFRKAGVAALDGNNGEMMKWLEAAGMNAASKVKAKITDGPFVPLSPYTIARRRAKLKGTTKLTPQQTAGGFVDIRPLIDTGQLRMAITYVIRVRGQDVGGGPTP